GCCLANSRLLEPWPVIATGILGTQPADNLQDFISGRHVWVVCNLLMPGEHAAIGAPGDGFKQTLVGHVLGILPAIVGNGRTDLAATVGTVALGAGVQAELLL